MSGTKAGGAKAAAKNLSNDPDFYKKIGRIGGSNGHEGGFKSDNQRAISAGAKGGTISRRGLKFISQTETEMHYTDNKTNEIVIIYKVV